MPVVSANVRSAEPVRQLTLKVESCTVLTFQWALLLFRLDKQVEDLGRNVETGLTQAVHRASEVQEPLLSPSREHAQGAGKRNVPPLCLPPAANLVNR